MSWLESAAHKFGSIFSFLESPKGQTIITAGEGVVTAIDPALAPAITLANSWIQKIFTTESVAAAALQSTGNGTQKAAVVIAAVTPDIEKYFPTTTATNIQVANTALVTFLNALGEPAPPVTATAPIVVSSTPIPATNTTTTA